MELRTWFSEGFPGNANWRIQTVTGTILFGVFPSWPKRSSTEEDTDTGQRRFLVSQMTSVQPAGMSAQRERGTGRPPQGPVGVGWGGDGYLQEG